MENIAPETIGWISLGVLLLLLALRVPVAIAMLTVGFVGYLMISGTQASFFAIGQLIYARVARYNFSVIPLFIIMGHFANHAGFVTDIFSTLRKWLGWVPGGLVHATIAGATAFGAACGSGVASCAIIGKICIPEMFRHGVDRKLALGAVAVAGPLAAMIPPSNLMVIYGLITEQSISRLLIAGIIPGIVAGLIFMTLVFIRVKINPSLSPPLKEKITWKDRFVSLKGIWGILLIALIIMGGIYSGVFTPTEAGGVGAAATFFIALALKRLSWSSLSAVLLDTIQTAGMIFLIFGCAAVFGYLMAITRIPEGISEWLAGLVVSKWLILMGVIILYLILGCIIDSTSQMILTMPIILPAMLALGFDPIWFGILMVHLMEIALITPPFALNIFVLKGVVEDTSITELIQAIIPFFFADLGILALYIIFPQLALWLPSLMK